MTVAITEAPHPQEVFELHELAVPLRPLGLEPGDTWQDGTVKDWVKLGSEAIARRRHEGVIHFNDKDKYVRITDPIQASANAFVEPEDDTLITLFHYLGFTEMVDAGSAQDLHDELAIANPDKRIISVATDGIGRNCPPQSLKDGLFETFNDVALSNAELASMLCGEQPVELFATSMNNHVIYRMARNVLNASGPWLDIRRLTFNMPALVARERVLQDVVGRFCVMHIGVDVTKEAVRHPFRAARYAAEVMSAVRLRQLHSYIGNAANMLKGMRWADMAYVADHYDTFLIAGGHDPLYQRGHWQTIGGSCAATHASHIDERQGHGAFIVNAQHAARLASAVAAPTTLTSV